MWWLTRVLLLAFSLGTLIVLSSNHLWTQIIGLVLMTMSGLIVIGYLLCDLIARIVRNDWRQHRNWGYFFGATGMILIALSPGPYKHENSIEVILTTIGIGIALLLVAWLVNHWPVRRKGTISRHNWS